MLTISSEDVREWVNKVFCHGNSEKTDTELSLVNRLYNIGEAPVVLLIFILLGSCSKQLTCFQYSDQTHYVFPSIQFISNLDQLTFPLILCYKVNGLSQYPKLMKLFGNLTFTLYSLDVGFFPSFPYYRIDCLSLSIHNGNL